MIYRKILICLSSNFRPIIQIPEEGGVEEEGMGVEGEGEGVVISRVVPISRVDGAGGGSPLISSPL